MANKLSALMFFIVCAIRISSLAASSSEMAQLRQELLGYLQNIQTLEASFQEKSVKREATGRLFLKRPPLNSSRFGQFKCVYNAPVFQVVISRDGTIYLHDTRAQSVDSTPLETTPFFVLLRPKIVLDQVVSERALWTDEHFIYWTLSNIEDDEEDAPNVTLIFKKHPTLALYGWQITDLKGNKTDISLQKIKMGHVLEDYLFQKP